MECVATGIGWRSGEPFLRLAEGDATRRQPLRLGDVVGWRAHGPRRCIGIWLPEIGEARACPNGRTIPAATATSQCPACAAADPGRAVARNLAIDDPRPYAVYLAWFGDGLVKVGLTAVARGTDRLAEQGALAFTWLARGPYRGCRRLEHATAATGTVHERISRSRKLAAWWRTAPTADPAGPPGPADAAGHDELAAAHEAATRDPGWPGDLDPVPFAHHDLTGLFGLDRPLPHPVRRVTALAGGAVLGGTLTVLAGHDALVDTAGGPLLVDLGLLAGWALTPAGGPTGATRGLTTDPFDPGPGNGRSGAGHPQQATLF
jgi:hypothetical protein